MKVLPARISLSAIPVFCLCVENAILQWKIEKYLFKEIANATQLTYCIREQWKYKRMFKWPLSQFQFVIIKNEQSPWSTRMRKKSKLFDLICTVIVANGRINTNTRSHSSSRTPQCVTFFLNHSTWYFIYLTESISLMRRISVCSLHGIHDFLFSFFFDWGRLEIGV